MINEMVFSESEFYSEYLEFRESVNSLVISFKIIYENLI